MLSLWIWQTTPQQHCLVTKPKGLLWNVCSPAARRHRRLHYGRGSFSGLSEEKPIALLPRPCRSAALQCCYGGSASPTPACQQSWSTLLGRDEKKPFPPKKLGNNILANSEPQ